MTEFRHRHTAHCENGATINLLGHHGLELSEAMAFGLGGGLFFAYLPFIKVGPIPLTSFRCLPGQIFGRATKTLGVKIRSVTYRDEERAMRELDALVDAGTPVGLQTGIFWLPYFPPALRFHFNAHNLVVYGREGDDYLVSDPVVDRPVRCSRADLRTARFAKGVLAPKGRAYWIDQVPADPPLLPAVRQGIRLVTRRMRGIPLPFFGTRGISLLARRLPGWPHRNGPVKAGHALAGIIRMQEEIGTGGAGFRYLYAAFLAEVARRWPAPGLAERADRLGLIGDQWRDFAAEAARVCKGRDPREATEAYAALGQRLAGIAATETSFFNDLATWERSWQP